jgi:hypothetical protein
MIVSLKNIFIEKCNIFLIDETYNEKTSGVGILFENIVSLLYLAIKHFSNNVFTKN